MTAIEALQRAGVSVVTGEDYMQTSTYISLIRRPLMQTLSACIRSRSWPSWIHALGSEQQSYKSSFPNAFAYFHLSDAIGSGSDAEAKFEWWLGKRPDSELELVTRDIFLHTTFLLCDGDIRYQSGGTLHVWDGMYGVTADNQAILALPFYRADHDGVTRPAGNLLPRVDTAIQHELKHAYDHRRQNKAWSGPQGDGDAFVSPRELSASINEATTTIMRRFDILYKQMCAAKQDLALLEWRKRAHSMQTTLSDFTAFYQEFLSSMRPEVVDSIARMQTDNEVAAFNEARKAAKGVFDKLRIMYRIH